MICMLFLQRLLISFLDKGWNNYKNYLLPRKRLTLHVVNHKHVVELIFPVHLINARETLFFIGFEKIRQLFFHGDLPFILLYGLRVVTFLHNVKNSFLVSLEVLDSVQGFLLAAFYSVDDIIRVDVVLFIHVKLYVLYSCENLQVVQNDLLWWALIVFGPYALSCSKIDLLRLCFSGDRTCV